MRVLAALILATILAGSAAAQDDPRRAQVRAAQDNAVRSLRDDVSRMAITPQLTVKDFLDRTKGNDQFIQTLQQSEQIGGPRWVGQGTCQVHLAISGRRVARALTQIAASSPQESPLPAEVLQKYLVDLDGRTFTATGTSAGAAAVEEFRPMADAWSRVTDASRKAAVQAAIRSAGQRVTESISPVAIAPGYSVSDALNNADAGKRFDAWLSDRPVTKVDFRDDLQVDVTLSAPAGEVTDALQAAVTGAKDVPAAVKETDWARVRQDVAGRLVPAVGRGQAEEGPAPTQPRAMVQLNDQGAPRWVGDQVSAEGTAQRQASRLKTARRAEEAALEKLQAHVYALPLTPKLAVADAARLDANLKERLGLAIAMARTNAVEYHEDGSVMVRVSLDLRDVWEAMMPSRR